MSNPMFSVKMNTDSYKELSDYNPSSVKNAKCLVYYDRSTNKNGLGPYGYNPHSPGPSSPYLDLRTYSP